MTLSCKHLAILTQLTTQFLATISWIGWSVATLSPIAGRDLSGEYLFHAQDRPVQKPWQTQSQARMRDWRGSLALRLSDFVGENLPLNWSERHPAGVRLPILVCRGARSSQTLTTLSCALRPRANNAGAGRRGVLRRPPCPAALGHLVAARQATAAACWPGLVARP
jgi:hypothetical protein